MTRTQRAIRNIGLWAFSGMAIANAGCMNAPLRQNQAGADGQGIGMPAPGSVPSELAMVNLPEYVIEAPDVLVINAVIRNTVTEEAAATDKIPFSDTPKKDDEKKDKDKVADKDKDKDKEPKPFGNTVRSLPIQPVFTNYQVRPDGTVFLGVYGSVPVAGLTLKQAAAAIRTSLARQIYPEDKGIDEKALLVVVDVSEYNSKSYFVIVDGGGAGERITKWPITGKETVLDALTNVGGLAEESSKRNVWVARRTPFANQPQQILPVDYVGVTQHGITTTNYQLFPGDRVYLKAQRLVTIDRTIARIVSPVERIFGITLLGTSSVNAIVGRGNGFGGGNNN
jgi:polysaccharide biosynthesis/export protein